MNEIALHHEEQADPMGTLMLSPSAMHALVAFAEHMANATVMVPKHLHGRPADCMAIAMQAAQWRMNPFVVAQKTHVVNGQLGYEAQLVNAVIQASGAVASRPHYEYRGEAQRLECRVGFKIAGEDAITWNEWLCIGDVKVKNSPLWTSNPKQQLGYLQVKNWARAFCPGAVLGIHRTVDDLLDMDEDEKPAPRGPRRKSDKGATPMVEEVPRNAAADPETGEAAPPAQAPAPSPTPAPPPPAAGSGGGITGGQVAYLRNKLKTAGLAEQSITDRFQVASLELLNAEQFDEIKAELLAMA